MGAIFDAAALLDAGMSDDLVTKLSDAYATVRALIESDYPLAVASSFGKDSCCVLAVTVQAYHDAIASGAVTYPLTVLTADTGIENPAVQSYTRKMIAHLVRYAKTHRLDIRVRIGKPSLAASWINRVIGGYGLPTFVNSATRDCSRDLKLRPNRRELAKLVPDLKAELAARAGKCDPGLFFRLNQLAAHLDRQAPVTLLGTRFAESTSRAHRMADRGDVARRITRSADGDLTLPLIADFELEDVWELLSLAGADAAKPFKAFAPNFNETQAIYADASGECVIVAGIQNKTAACGARHGCAVCTAIGTDKSMETMLLLPQYEYMRGLNKLRNFLLATQYDLSRRRWIGRTADPVTGYIRLAPDVYSPAMTEELLGIVLSLDADEQQRAAALDDALYRYEHGDQVDWPDEHMRLTARAGSPDLAYAREMAKPQFQLVTPEALVHLDLTWSRYGVHRRPFHALWIYREIYHRGRRWSIPQDIKPTADRVMPAPMWLEVPEGESLAHPFFDIVAHSLDEKPGMTLHAVSHDTMTSPIEDEQYTVDEEALWFLLEYEMDQLLDLYHDMFSPMVAAERYFRTGMISVPHGHKPQIAATIRHSQRIIKAGIGFGPPSTELLATAISDVEHRRLKARIEAGDPTALPADTVPVGLLSPATRPKGQTETRPSARHSKPSAKRAEAQFDFALV